MQVSAPPIHPYLLDPDRLAALAGSGLLSEDVEPALDRWTRLAGQLVGVPSAFLTTVGAEFVWTKSHVGLPPEVAATRDVPVGHSFCQHVVARREAFVVTDALEDPRIDVSAESEEFGVRAYAGQPVTTSDGHVLGSFCVMDVVPRAWTDQELALLEDLAAGLVAEVQLRVALRTSLELQDELARQARVDALTGIANRRQLADDLAQAVAGDGPPVLAVFDLNGFKLYNDAFGHPAGDALLARLAGKLAGVAAEASGTAYRLGGDEFCVLVADAQAVGRAADALREHGDGFAISSSFGVVRLDGPPITAEQAMQMADDRLYGHKNGRLDAALRQAQDVLLSVLREREPELDEHVRQVAVLARRVAGALGLEPAAVDEIGLVASMHDIGKVAVPDSILCKPGPLDEGEWAIMRQHTLFGERILCAAPALRSVAGMVRATHERWDGTGYPDGLAGTEIPLAARVVLTCDAFHAMTSHRPYAAARTGAAALAELREHAGSQFDPAVVEALELALG